MQVAASREYYTGHIGYWTGWFMSRFVGWQYYSRVVLYAVSWGEKNEKKFRPNDSGSVSRHMCGKVAS